MAKLIASQLLGDSGQAPAMANRCERPYHEAEDSELGPGAGSHFGSMPGGAVDLEQELAAAIRCEQSACIGEGLGPEREGESHSGRPKESLPRCYWIRV